MFLFFSCQPFLLKNFIYRPVWLCSQCFVCYDNKEIEMRIIDVVQRKIMSYTLQDLRCVRCKQIKRENMTPFCSCAGDFENLIPKPHIKNLLGTFREVAEKHEMILLNELIQSLNMTYR